MAIITFGAMVVGARGTVGGLTYSANKAGPFVKSWSRGGNPRTVLQTDNRNVLAARSVAWAGLTQAQRDDWDDYADDPAQELVNSLGQDYFASGFNWYITINSALLQADETVRVDAPTITRPIAPEIDFFNTFETPSASVSQMRFLGADPPRGDQKVLFIRSFNSEGRGVASSGFQLVTNQEPNVDFRIFFQTELEGIFGDLQVGQRFFAEVFNQDAHGQRSPVTTDVDDAAA